MQAPAQGAPRAPGRPLGGLARAVLRALELQPLSARELRHALGLPATVIAQLVTRLVAAGHIEVETTRRVPYSKKPVAVYRLPRVAALPSLLFGTT